MDRPRFNPFPGLRSFEPDEDRIFFGRDKQVDELLKALRKTQFLSVVGGSGSGKSSLVKSGLIPALHGGFMAKASSTWRVALCRPGLDPTHNLAVALSDVEVLGRHSERAEDRELIMDAVLRRSGQGLMSAVQEARLPADENLLVVVDQFEELFRFKRIRANAGGRDEAVSFVTLLLEAARQTSKSDYKGVPVYVVLTMRSEFIGNCAEIPGLAEAVNEGQYLVPRMTRDELRLAITGPVAVGGGEIAPRLVTRLLNEIGDDADQLPVLQHALLRTWDYWEKDHATTLPIDVDDYVQIGTMLHALSRHAEEAYAEVSEIDRPLAERVFKALTETTGEGLGLRRPCTLQELKDISGEKDTDGVTRVVAPFRKLGRTFLLPPEGSPLDLNNVLDLSHESLMRLWTRLVDWTRDEARWADIYRRLSETSARRAGGGGAELYRGVDLDAALQWLETQRPTGAWAARYDTKSSGAQRDPGVQRRADHPTNADGGKVTGAGPKDGFDGAVAFLKASKAERDAEVKARAAESAEKELLRQREIEAREAVAAEKEHSRRREEVQLRRFRIVTAVVFGAASIVAAGMLVYASSQSRQTKAANSLANAARIQATKDSMAAAKANSAADSARAEARKDRMAAASARAAADSAENEALVQRKRAREANDIAKVARDSTLRANELAAVEREFARLANISADAARDSALRANAAATAASESARTLRELALSQNLAAKARGVWSVEDRHVPALLARLAYNLVPDSVRERDPNLDAALRAGLTAIDTAFVKRWTRNHGGGVRAIVVDGTLLVTGSDDGRVRVFGATDSVLMQFGEEDGSPIRSVALDPTGRWLAAGAMDSTVRVWKRDTTRKGAKPMLVTSQVGAVIGMGFDRQGRLVWAGPGGVRMLPDISALRPTSMPLPLDSLNGARILSFTLSPDKLRFAVGLDDGRVLERTLGGSRSSGGVACRATQKTQLAWVTAVTYLPGSERIAVGCAGGTLALLDGAASRQPVHGAAVTAIAAAGGILATSSLDGTVLLWQLDASGNPADFTRVPARLSSHKKAAQDSWVWAVALDPTGHLVYSGSEDRGVHAQPTRVRSMADMVCDKLKEPTSPRDLTKQQREEHLPKDEQGRLVCP